MMPYHSQSDKKSRKNVNQRHNIFVHFDVVINVLSTSVRDNFINENIKISQKQKKTTTTKLMICRFIHVLYLRRSLYMSNVSTQIFYTPIKSLTNKILFSNYVSQ